MPLPFEFSIEGPAISVQASSRSRLAWKARVLAAATKVWPTGEGATADQVEVKIDYFYLVSPPDVDNIIKPIQDALKGLVYVDDNQVVRTSCSKRPLDGKFRVIRMAPLLAEGFVAGKEFLRIRVLQPGDLEELD